MKKIKINGLVILVISLFLLWYVLKRDFKETINLLLYANILLIILSLIIYGIHTLLESIVTWKLIKQFDDKYSLKETFKLTLMTRFFNGITPFSSGGQPLQIYQLKKSGISVVNGTIMTIEHFIIFQTSIVIMSLMAVLFNTIYHVIDSKLVLSNLLVLGFILNILLLLIVYLFSISKNLNKKIILWIIKILQKVKIVKDYEKIENKMLKACNSYYDGFRRMTKNIKMMLELILIEIIALCIWFIIPLVIFWALGYHGNLNLGICLLISIYVFFIGSYIPLPGGSGGIEYAFMGYFQQYVSLNYLSAGLILWRFVSYYLPMFIGFIIFNFFGKRKEEDLDERNNNR